MRSAIIKRPAHLRRCARATAVLTFTPNAPAGRRRDLASVLKYGADMEVIVPDALKEAVKIQLNAAASQYRRGNAAGSGFEPEP